MVKASGQLMQDSVPGRIINIKFILGISQLRSNFLDIIFRYSTFQCSVKGYCGMKVLSLQFCYIFWCPVQCFPAILQMLQTIQKTLCEKMSCNESALSAWDRSSEGGFRVSSSGLQLGLKYISGNASETGELQRDCTLQSVCCSPQSRERRLLCWRIM